MQPQQTMQPQRFQNVSDYTQHVYNTRLPYETKTSTFTTSLNVFQFVLDVVGIIPPFGWVADMASVLISLLRRQYINAMLSAISIIPVAGNAVGKPLKYIRKLT